MSWRFRKSFKVLPGVKLHLSRNGLSATIGAAPCGVNIGPRGVYQNVSIPGTGISSRQRIDSALGVSLEPTHHEVPPADIPASPVGSGVLEIRSANTEFLTSTNLDSLKALLTEAYNERSTLRKEVAAAEREFSAAKRRYHSWSQGFLFKNLFKRSFASRKDSAETSEAKFLELKEQLRLTTLATQIEIDNEQSEQYFRMRNDFGSLSGCRRIWDTLDRRAVNRVAERSAAHECINRATVQFSLSHCDLIEWEQSVPHLPNRNGGDLYVYPGFVLYRASKQAFALIDFREVKLASRAVQFIEEEPVPSDSQVVGRAWAKSNKDGSPDRRFKENYQIPIARYGVLTFTSSTGLYEEYQFSNPELTERFAGSWNKFASTFEPK